MQYESKNLPLVDQNMTLLTYSLNVRICHFGCVLT